MGAIPEEKPTSYTNADLAGYSGQPVSSFAPTPVEGQTGVTKGMSAVDDILQRIAASAQQPTHVNQGMLASTRDTLNQDMGGYRAAMDQHQQSRPVMSPKMASEMAIMKDTTANPIWRRNSAGEVYQFRDRMAAWEQQGKAIADKYGMLGKMQGQLYGQETGALGLEAAGRKQDAAINMDVAQEGMKLQALPTNIAKAQSDIAQTNAETDDIKKNGGKASQANQQKDLALFSNGLNSINTMRQRQQALRAKSAKELTPEESKELQGLSDDAIEQYEERLAKLHPELAAKAGIQVLTPEQKVARQSSRQIQAYMDAARKHGVDEARMADVLSKAGYKDEYIRQAIPTYKGSQPQGGSTVAKRTQDESQKPPMEGARLAPDGNWYVQKDGKYHMVGTGKEEKSQKKIRLEGM